VTEAERRRLVLLAYRICGSWADAEDVVQQASLEWLRLVRPAGNPAGWLTRTTVRRAIDVLRARQRAASYAGPWLPEPVVTDPGPHDAVEHEETLSMAFLTLAETLTPPQRAVVVLRALDFSHAEIAAILDITAAASRQHQLRATRRLELAGPSVGRGPAARQSVEDGVAAQAAGPAARMSDGGGAAAQAAHLLGAFVAAARSGDVDRLTELLHADVRAYQDGGGKARAARRVLVGAANVARFTVGVAGLHRARRTVAFVDVNGAPGAVIMLSGIAHVLSAEIRDGRIYRLFDVCNPDKLTTLRRVVEGAA